MSPSYITHVTVNSVVFSMKKIEPIKNISYISGLKSHFFLANEAQLSHTHVLRLYQMLSIL